MKIGKQTVLSIVSASVLAVGASLAAHPAVAADSDQWKIDPSHSGASFSVRHMMISNVKGDFGDVAGKVTYDGKNLSKASVQATIDATTIDTNEAKRDEHLKGDDFLNVKKFPELKFVSTKVVPKKDGSFDLIGNLTMHGVTKKVTLKGEPLTKAIKDPYGNTRMGASATTKVNRKDFGISFDKTMDNGGALVGDEVKIDLNIELIKQSAAPAKKAS